MSLNFRDLPEESGDFISLPSLEEVKKRVAAGEQPDEADLSISLFNKRIDIYKYLAGILKKTVSNSRIRSEISDLEEEAHECDYCIPTDWLEDAIYWNNLQWFGEHEGLSGWNEAVRQANQKMSPQEIESLIQQADSLEKQESPSDQKRAAELYRLAALQGNPKAMFKYSITSYCEEDIAKFLLVEAAKKGYAPAQAKLGFYLSSAEPNGGSARMWLEKAAEQNDPDAFKWLAHMYDYGEGGVKKDPEKADRFRLKAAQNGSDDEDILKWMAETYKEGNSALNIQASPEKSIEILMNLRDTYSLLKVAKAYLSGWGVEKSKEKAVEWLKRTVEETIYTEALAEIMEIYKSLGMEQEYFQTARKALSIWKGKEDSVKNPISTETLLIAMDYDGDRAKMKTDIAQKIKYYQELIAKGKMN